MPGRFKCPCGADLPTLRGLRSHESQSRECRAWSTRAKATVSTSSSEDEALEGPSYSEPTSPLVESMQLSDDEYQTENIGSPLPPDPPVIQDSDEETIPTASQKRPYVEDSDDEDDEPRKPDSVYIQEFPAHLRAGEKKGEIKTQFETLRERQKAEDLEPWFPFPSEDEWELARWLVESGASQSKIDSFMKLKTVCTCLSHRKLLFKLNCYPNLKDQRRSTNLQKRSRIFQIHRCTASRTEIFLYPSQSKWRLDGRQW